MHIDQRCGVGSFRADCIGAMRRRIEVSSCRIECQSVCRESFGSKGWWLLKNFWPTSLSHEEDRDQPLKWFGREKMSVGQLSRCGPAEHIVLCVSFLWVNDEEDRLQTPMIKPDATCKSASTCVLYPKHNKPLKDLCYKFLEVFMF